MENSKTPGNQVSCVLINEFCVSEARNDKKIKVNPYKLLDRYYKVDNPFERLCEQNLWI